ncbi:MAG: hypothetical protein V3T83_07620 [Acidobacteriota bacterium]
MQGPQQVERARHRAARQHGHHLEVERRLVILGADEAPQLLAALLTAQEGRPRLQVAPQGEAGEAQLLQPEARHIGLELGAVEPDVEKPVLLGRRRLALAVDQVLAGAVLPLEAQLGREPAHLRHIEHLHIGNVTPEAASDVVRKLPVRVVPEDQPLALGDELLVQRLIDLFSLHWGPPCWFNHRCPSSVRR